MDNNVKKPMYNIENYNTFIAMVRSIESNMEFLQSLKKNGRITPIEEDIFTRVINIQLEQLRSHNKRIH